MTNEPGDVFQGHLVIGQKRNEGMPHLTKGPLLRWQFGRLENVPELPAQVV
jgi:hypothetical protein